MAHEVYAFGDSHWRLFFPFTNHGSPGPRHEQDGIVTIDTTANELSGATMWGLQRVDSTHRARLRILNTIDTAGGVDNVGLVFGEVDVRYHWTRYYKDGKLSVPAVLQLLTAYRRFIDEELLSGRVRNKVFVYYGFRYNPGTPNQTHRDRIPTAEFVLDLHRLIEQLMPHVMSQSGGRIVTITPCDELEGQAGLLHPDFTDKDGIHPLPEQIFPRFVFPVLKAHLNPDPPVMREIAL